MKNTIKIKFEIDDQMVYNLTISGNSHNQGKGLDYQVNIDKEKLINFVKECSLVTKFDRDRLLTM